MCLLYFHYFPDGKVLNVNCWAWGRIVIPRELSLRDQMILYTAFHAQIVCAVPTELTIRDLHQQLDLLTEFDGCHITYDFVSMPCCCWLYFWYCDCFIFPLSIWWEGIHSNFRGSKRILLKVSLIWLYIWIEFQGSGIFFCTWCQFRTEWQPFSFAGISSRTLTDGFTYEWAPAVSNKLMIKEPKWHTRVPSHPACTLTWWSTIFHVLRLWQALCTFTKFRVSLHTI